MSNFPNPRTVPIALVVAGMFIIAFAIYAYSFGQRTDILLTVVLVVIGLVVLFSAIPVNMWEKEKYYANRPFG